MRKTARAGVVVGLLGVAMAVGAGPWSASRWRASGAPAQPTARLSFDTSEWTTNFAKHSVPLSEILPGGPSKDGIPAIDHPKFVTVAAADAWLGPHEPVIFFEHRGDARAYPLEILIWHEIVNDAVGGLPVVITFCPLCHTAIAFDRTVGSRTLDFGTTGNLRFSDLVMYDRQTESWWQQATGEAIVGDLTGTQLHALPAQIIGWATFAHAFPDGHVLSRDTGYRRPYGQNPYVGYDDIRSSPFLYRGPIDRRLPPMERVVAVSIGGEDVAYPFSVLRRLRVVNDTVAGKAIVVLFDPGVTSALDQGSIATSRAVGTAGVFERAARGTILTFGSAAGRIVDRQTGSVWTILGTAVAGPLTGLRLTPLRSDEPFWFAWAVFRPGTRVYRP